jgi:hypothetical protein
MAVAHDFIGRSTHFLARRTTASRSVQLTTKASDTEPHEDNGK